jgi:hypothetical protein
MAKIQQLDEAAYDADQGGSDFINSLPEPEIKTTEDLIATATPATPTPKPTDAMLRGKELSQTQFDGMQPVYESTGGREGQRELVGYKFGMSQVQEPGMTASYSSPTYVSRGRGGAQVLVDPGGKLLGYQYTGTVDPPKPDAILAYEKQFGTTMEPIYATRTRQTRGGEAEVAYGPPIGYRFDNGQSQYVNFDASGQHTSTVNREKPGALGNIALTVLSLAYPPIAPFIQAYNAAKALDSGDTLGFILGAAGAGKSIPGLDKNTISMLNNVSTGAKIIKAVESGDPLKILTATASIPNVDPDLKDLSIVINTANAINKGNIAGAINGITKMSDRDSVGRLTERFDDIINGSDVAALDPSQVAALTPDEPIDDTLTNAGLVNSDVIDKTPEEQEQEDREQAAREAIRASEKTIEDTLTDAGLVPPNNAQELDLVNVSGKALPENDLPITDASGGNRITNSSLPVNPNVGEPPIALDRQEITGKRILEDDLPITSDTGGNRVTDSSIPVNPNVGTTLPALAPVTVTTKGLLGDDLPITGDTGGNRVTDSSLPVNPNVGEPLQEFKPVTVTGKRDQELEPVTIVGKREPEQELPPVTIIGKKEEPVIPKIPVIPTVPTTTTKPAPAKPAPKNPATPEEQFYQTITQSNPTTLADIKYYLDMASGGMVPPENSSDPLESLLNQPMSVEELLYHLRS